MITCQTNSKRLICFQQVSHICTCVILTCVTITLWINWAKVFCIGSIFNYQASIASHTRPISSNPCRQNTVVHIDSTDNTINQTIWRPYSHKITRFVFRKQRYSKIQYGIHLFMSFSNRKTTNRIPWKIHRNQIMRRLSAKVFETSSLYNTKKPLIVWPTMGFQSTLCPTTRTFDRFFDIIIWLVKLRTFVKAHHNI